MAGASFARVVTFVTDSVHIVFFECVFAVTLNGYLSVQLHALGESFPLPLRGLGGAFLAGLACVEPGQIGYGMPACVVDGTAAELRTFLGMGATASGFAATWKGDPVVVKMMRPSQETDDMDAEEQVLRALGTVPGIVKLVARKGPLFLLKPLGAVSYSLSAPSTASRAPVAGDGALWAEHTSDLRPSDLDIPLAGAVLPMAADFCALVDALALMHQAGFVHRDPRPDNFFRTAAREFILGDLGSAVAIGSTDGATRPFGFTYGPAAALVALAMNTPLPAAQPEHDMEQVARLVYAALARDWNTLPAHAPAAQLLEWWRVRDELNPLATLLQLAREACSGEEAAREAFKDGIRRTLL